MEDSRKLLKVAELRMEALFKEKIIADKIIEEVIGFVALFRRGEPLVMN